MTITAYINARIIDPANDFDGTGTLVVENGVITAIGSDVAVPDGTEAIDCKGLILAPGLVDMRSFSADGAAAAKGGITTAVLMPNGTPPLDSEPMVDHRLRQARDKQPINVSVMGAATKGLAGEDMAEIGLMSEAGAIAFTDGRHAIADATLMRRLMEYATATDHLIVQFPEEPSLALHGVMNEGALATKLGLQGIPTAAEAMMIERDLRLRTLTGGRYHVAQISCGDAIDVVRGAKDEGITCATSPQYFALNEAAIEDYRTFARLSPPLRGEDDRAAVVEAIRDGTIDVICSSHDPKDEEGKRLPFAQAADGALGYETMLTLALELHHNHDVPLMVLLRAMTSAPADILQLPAGRLSTGAPADLVLFALDTPWRIDAEAMLSETRNTPFDGRPVQGQVMRTIVAGDTVYLRNGP